MITVVGEALLDLVAEPGGRSFAAHPGGSPANVAVGLARLGTPVTLGTQLGDDLPGELVSKHLADSGVPVHRLPARTESSSLAFAAVDEAGVASYDFRIAWDITEPRLAAGTRCVHTGSIAMALQPGADAVEHLLATERARGEATLSLDPNIRPSLLTTPRAERARVERQVKLADVVKASSEDLAWLYPNQNPTDVARSWAETGSALVIVTLGEHGAFGVCADGEVTRNAPVMDIADTVGAGDAFTAGMLDRLDAAGLLGGAHRDALAGITTAALTDVLDFALTVATITCTRAGANPPTRAELDNAASHSPT